MIKNIIDTSKKYLTKLGFTSLSQQFLEYINDGKIQEALHMVESGVDIKIASFGNTTALMSVCSRNYEIFKNSPLLRDATKEHKKTYFDLFYCMINSKKMTLSHLNEKDDDGNTAVHYTVAFKNIEMLQELIKKVAYSDILPTIDILKMKNNLEADMPDKPEKQEKKRKI